MSLDFTCSCGQTTWRVDAPKQGTRLICYCADCQTAARHLGADVLNDGGGTEILQVGAHQVHIEGPPLALVRLSPKGIFRWHTSCCNTPVANTLPFPQLSFAGVLLANLADKDAPLPPMAAVVNTVYAKGRPDVPAKDFGLGKSVLRFFKRSLTARMSGTWKQTPFFEGPPWEPVAVPRILTKDERNAARP